MWAEFMFFSAWQVTNSLCVTFKIMSGKCQSAGPKSGLCSFGAQNFNIYNLNEVIRTQKCAFFFHNKLLSGETWSPDTLFEHR